MADEPMVGEGLAIDSELERDPVARARLIDELMAPPPKGLPAILVFGDEAVFGITPPRHRKD